MGPGGALCERKKVAAPDAEKEERNRKRERERLRNRPMWTPIEQR